jgi:hypothetical protein
MYIDMIVPGTVTNFHSLGYTKGLLLDSWHDQFHPTLLLGYPTLHTLSATLQ